MDKKSPPDAPTRYYFEAQKPIDSFDKLYKQYVKKVYQQCLSLAKNSEIAQDYTQDIFIKAFTKLDSFQNRSTFSTWLFAITHNYCLDQLQKNKRRCTVDLSDKLIQSLTEPDKQISVNYQLQQLDGLLEKLPVDEASMIRLKYEQNLSVKQLSQLYQLTESAIKMRLSRSREKLQRMHAQQLRD